MICFKRWLGGYAVVLLVAMFALPLQSSSTRGVGDPCKADADCAPGLVCVVDHYVRVLGLWKKEVKACAREGAASQATFVDDILELGTHTVRARRIEPPKFRIFQWSPPPPPWVPPPAQPPPPQPPEEEEEEEDFTFGICSRPLGGEYKVGLTEEEQKRIAIQLDRHEDVVWEKTTASETNSRSAAGFFAVDFWSALWLGWVNGEIRNASPAPSACKTKKIDEARYKDVVAKVAAHRANPPAYHLVFYNCKSWADDIEALTLE